MRIHIYFKNEDEGSLRTERVTCKDGALILGTGERQRRYELKDVAWYWVEIE